MDWAVRKMGAGEFRLSPIANIDDIAPRRGPPTSKPWRRMMAGNRSKIQKQADFTLYRQSPIANRCIDINNYFIGASGQQVFDALVVN
jgi:hypothetical protein